MNHIMSMSAFHYLLIILFVGLDNSANDFDNYIIKQCAKYNWIRNKSLNSTFSFKKQNNVVNKTEVQNIYCFFIKFVEGI